ncbi:MAG: tetratricopeptide repeat protein [Flavobacteriales bacterium]
MLLIGGTGAFAQKKAIDLMEKQRYADAARAFEKHLKKNSEDGASYENLGNVYRKLRDFPKAELNYERADIYGGLTSNGFVNYGQVLVKNGKSTEARKQFERYLQMEPESFVVRTMMQSLREVEAWSHAPQSYDVKSVSGLNSEFSDFAPVVYQNGIAFTTERNQDLVNDNSSGWSNLPYLAVFYSEFKDEHGLEFNRPKNFLSRLYGDYHVGPITIDTVNHQAIFTEVGSSGKRDDVPRLKTYVAEIIKGKRLDKPQLLPVANADTFSVAHASISPDGNTLFFVSDMPGGVGGMDIYIMKRNAGGWGDPSLLNGSVNTELNEVFPYARSATHLYFASNGHAGYGGLDIFESHLVDGSWTQPINLKSPVNSEGDDFGITFYNQNRGYFSSERDGGQGKDDIYQFIKVADPDDQDRVAVNGVFEYSKIPKDGIMLRLLDEEDNLLEEVYTDSVGNFVFTQLPTNKNYKVEVANIPKYELAEASIFLVNESGEKVLILDRLNESEFKFTTLPKDEFDSMALLDEEDNSLGSYEIFGQLYSMLPTDNVSGMTLMILDEEGNIIDEIQTDSIGMYEFTNLSKTQHYTIKLIDKDSIIRKSTVYYEDDIGVTAVADSGNNLFHLERMVAARLSEMKNEVPTRGYVEYEGQPVKNIRLMMVDSSNAHLRASKSSGEGYFDFGRIAANQKFNFILPDSVSKLPGQLNIYLINENGEKVVFAQKDAEKHFAFTSLSAEEYSPNLLSEVDTKLDQYGIYGQVFRKLPGDYKDGLTIVALDDKGRVIETVVADASGNFKFTKLKPDQQYTFNVEEQDQGELQVSIFDTKGNLVDELRLEELASYVYQKLGSEEAILFQVAAEDEGSLKEELVSGMVYKKLPGDYKEGILVFAVDEHGNVLDSAYTDREGNFKFSRLNRQEDFTLRVMDEDDSEMMVGFYNYEGQFDGLITLDETNAFEYSKIILEAASELGRLDETDQSSNKLYGQVYKKLPGDYQKGMKVYAYDANGIVIDEAVIDEEGKFQFKKLSADGTYSIRLADDNDNATFALLDKNGNKISEIDQSDGEFVWNKLARDEYQLALAEADDYKLDGNKYKVPKNTKPLKSADNLVYFEYKRYILSADDSSLLASIVKSMQADEGRYLHIQSHSDQSEMTGLRSYSALRSVSIVRYLNAYGISSDRLYVQNWEHDKPVVDCSEGNPCSEADRAKNQRTELSIVDVSNMPSTPKLRGILDSMNGFCLAEEGQNPVFHLIPFDERKSNMEGSIGWICGHMGAYSSNQRISTAF